MVRLLIATLIIIIIIIPMLQAYHMSDWLYKVNVSSAVLLLNVSPVEIAKNGLRYLSKNARHIYWFIRFQVYIALCLLTRTGWYLSTP